MTLRELINQVTEDEHIDSNTIPNNILDYELLIRTFKNNAAFINDIDDKAMIVIHTKERIILTSI